MITNLEETDKFIVDFYTELFTSQGDTEEQWMRDIVFSQISQDSESELTLPTDNDIHEIVKSMNRDSAKGPDGLTIKFFQHCWKFDVVQVAWDFLKGTACPKIFMAIKIIPIPK